MTRAARVAFNKLVRMGAPVIESREHGCHFINSAENNHAEVWADYYMEYGIHKNSEIPGVHPKICSVLSDHDLIAQWFNPGMLGVYDA